MATDFVAVDAVFVEPTGDTGVGIFDTMTSRRSILTGFVERSVGGAIGAIAGSLIGTGRDAVCALALPAKASNIAVTKMEGFIFFLVM